VTLGGEVRKAMADQLTTVSKMRLGEVLGHLSSEDISSVERAIKVQLGIA
jgi:mRNA interferase MazF